MKLLLKNEQIEHGLKCQQNTETKGRSKLLGGLVNQGPTCKGRERNSRNQRQGMQLQLKVHITAKIKGLSRQWSVRPLQGIHLSVAVCLKMWCILLMVWNTLNFY